MVEERAHPDGRLEHPSVRHERTDASFGWVLGLILASIGLAALIFYLLMVFLQSYGDRQAAIKRSSYPLASTPRERLPAEPRLEQLNRLQENERPNVYLRQLRKEEVLNSYGPTPEEGFIHIPIGRALTLVEQKLPVRKEQPSGDPRRANGLVDAGESNSGRMFREEPRWDQP
jgi:hypothetical protein